MVAERRRPRRATPAAFATKSAEIVLREFTNGA
jgi:hypothetical protein